MTARRSLMLAVFLTVAPFVGRPVAADPVVQFTGGMEQPAFGGPTTLGWSFTVGSSPITIGGLGIFDIGANGLAESHMVGLWNSGGTLLASASIDSAGTHVASTSSAGDWLFTALSSSVQLTTGDYVVGAFYAASSPDHFMGGNANPSTISGVTFGQGQAAAGSSLKFPAPSDQLAGFFGPNLFAGAVPTPPVPEPKTYAMLMAGLVLLGFIARRRGKSLNAAA